MASADQDPRHPSPVQRLPTNPWRSGLDSNIQLPFLKLPKAFSSTNLLTRGAVFRYVSTPKENRFWTALQFTHPSSSLVCMETFLLAFIHLPVVRMGSWPDSSGSLSRSYHLKLFLPLRFRALFVRRLQL